jgi:hypothetical protein
MSLAGGVPDQGDWHRCEAIDSRVAENHPFRAGIHIVNGNHDILSSVVGNFDLDALAAAR